jgi:hypothetical protein
MVLTPGVSIYLVSVIYMTWTVGILSYVLYNIVKGKHLVCTFIFMTSLQAIMFYICMTVENIYLLELLGEYNFIGHVCMLP